MLVTFPGLPIREWLDSIYLLLISRRRGVVGEYCLKAGCSVLWWTGGGTRETEKEPEKTEITNNEERRRKKIRYFLGGIQCTRYLFVGNEYRRYLLGDIQGRRYLFDGIMCWRYGFG